VVYPACPFKAFAGRSSWSMYRCALRAGCTSKAYCAGPMYNNGTATGSQLANSRPSHRQTTQTVHCMLDAAACRPAGGQSHPGLSGIVSNPCWYYSAPVPHRHAGHPAPLCSTDRWIHHISIVLNFQPLMAASSEVTGSAGCHPPSIHAIARRHLLCRGLRALPIPPLPGLLLPAPINPQKP
jgi:hypothetical protein